MRILANFPYSPFTNKTGSGQRFLQNIRGLRDLGHQVTIWSISSIDKNSSHRWKVEDLLLAEDEGFKVELTDSWELPQHLLRKIDLVWCNYYHCVDLFDQFDGPIVTEMHDLLSVHAQQASFLESHLIEVDGKKKFKDHSLFNPKEVHIFPVDLAEIRAYKKCKCVVAISSSEHKILESVGVRSKYVPYQDFTEYPLSERTGPPIFVGTKNIFNLFAVEYLGELIVPSVRSRCFDFEAQIVGEISQDVHPFVNLRFRPYCSSIEEVFRNSSFGLCPMLFATGTQIKLIEMMKHGLPIVTFNCRVGDLPIIYNETGFPCFSMEEFVDSCVRLWQSRSLRIRLGNNAQEAMTAMYSKNDHLKDLENILK